MWVPTRANASTNAFYLFMMSRAMNAQLRCEYWKLKYQNDILHLYFSVSVLNIWKTFTDIQYSYLAFQMRVQNGLSELNYSLVNLEFILRIGWETINKRSFHALVICFICSSNSNASVVDEYMQCNIEAFLLFALEMGRECSNVVGCMHICRVYIAIALHVMSNNNQISTMATTTATATMMMHH